MAQGKIPAEQRALYKETARRIVGADRDARKYGWSQNTIGEIERALVAAFLDGCTQGGDKGGAAQAGGGLTWTQLPPRSRDTLRHLSFGLSRRFDRVENPPLRIERFEEADKLRWREVDATGARGERSVADGSVAPLVRLRLLEPSQPGSDLFQLTEEGVRLCRDYWEKDDRGDRTLPRISLR